MKRVYLFAISLGISFIASVGALGEVTPQRAVDTIAAIEKFRQQHPSNRLYEVEGRITRIYGSAMSHGGSPEHSAEGFVQEHAGIWGIGSEDLIPFGPFPDGRHTQPIMFDQATNTYKFTGVYYTQVRDGIPVFGGQLTLLTLNKPENPVILVSADIRNIGAFQVNDDVAKAADFSKSLHAARLRFGKHVQIIAPKLVIWAGIGSTTLPPVFAEQTIAVRGHERWLLVTDSITGSVLYEDYLIKFGKEVTGNVSGNVTDGIRSDICELEVPKPLPYLYVTSGASTATTDVNGNFSISPDGKTVDATLNGLWFDALNMVGPNTSESVPATTPADILFNFVNLSDEIRAQVNAYHGANVARDFVLRFNPSYPLVSQGGFALNVNQPASFYCPGNAWYVPPPPYGDGPSLNFCGSDFGPPQMAWSSVIYHEYGHHLIHATGVLQLEFAEGMADVLSVLILDNPFVASACGVPARNADNDCQYQNPGCSTCGSAQHACGQLISGCVWSLRNELINSGVSNYIDVLSNLAINSILLHSGHEIRPDITIDYLTLDDENGDICDGTPHYDEIAAAFGAHNLDAPPLSDIRFEYPNGRPDFIAPDGTTVIRVEVLPLSGTPQSGTAEFRVDLGSGFTTNPMTEVAPNVYDASFPASACGTTVRYYFSAKSSTNDSFSSPCDAPGKPFQAFSAYGLGPIIFEDNFESDLGWTVENENILNGEGVWERGVPITHCDRGNPLVDGDGSGACYLTQNDALDCDSDVEGDTTRLVSPPIDASQDPALLSYWRWYSNGIGSKATGDVLRIEASDDDGFSWEEIEVVGPSVNAVNPEVRGGWFEKRFSLSSIQNVELSDQFRLRFSASDFTDSIIEAAVDGVAIQCLRCTVCAADMNLDQQVNVDDLLTLISAWGVTHACREDLNLDRQVNVDDLLLLISQWGPC